MEQVREDIYLRDPKLAFKNATGLKVMVKPQDYMYMYTWKKSDGKLYDVFKHQLTRKNINVLMEGQ